MVICNAPLACPVLSTSSPQQFTFFTASLPTSPIQLSPLSTCPSTPLSPCSYSSSPSSISLSPHISLPSIPSLPMSPGLLIQPSSWKQSYGMEQVWLSEFNRFFTSFYPHIWFVQPVEVQPMSNKLINTFVDSAKVRFCCDKCGHGWTSMKGRVAFWFDLLPPYYSQGFVAFKLFGQKCERCKIDRYEQAMWYPEEVSKVLANLYNRIGQIYYGFYQPQIEKSRRSGKPRTPHNSDLCQACKDGVCTDRK